MGNLVNVNGGAIWIIDLEFVIQLNGYKENGFYALAIKFFVILIKVIAGMWIAQRQRRSLLKSLVRNWPSILWKSEGEFAHILRRSFRNFLILSYSHLALEVSRIRFQYTYLDWNVPSSSVEVWQFFMAAQGKLTVVLDQQNSWNYVSDEIFMAHCKIW